MDSQKSNRLHGIESSGPEGRAGRPATRNTGRTAVGAVVGAAAVAVERAVAERGAVAPKRARGRLRVEAILAASAAVFSERGYEAATMTEIAQRSETAIGSLYRFFPNKTALADLMVDHYLSQVMTHFDEVAGMGAIGKSSAAAAAEAVDGAARLADALVRMMTSLLDERASVLALVDAQGAVAAPLRARLRDAMLERLKDLLQAATDASPARAMASAKIVLLLLKGVPTLVDGHAAGRVDEQDAGVDDLRALIAHQVRRT